MKIFVVLASVIMIGFIPGIALSDVKQVVTLETVVIDGEQTPYVGQLTLDEVPNKMTLRIFEDPCGSLKPADGRMHCMAAAHLVVELSVPVIERSFPCGSVQISGSEDLSPVDGLRTEMVYLNHSTRMCKDIVFDLITVEASTFNPWDNKTTHYSLKTKK